MMKSKRFEPIEAIATASAETLSRTMAEAGGRVAELERQLEQLQKYRDEYLRKSTAAGAMNAVNLHNFRFFLERLAEALRQHTVKLGAARAEYDSRRAAWSTKRIEAETLGRAIGRFRQEERQVGEQREQREADDAALRIAVANGEARGR